MSDGIPEAAPGSGAAPARSLGARWLAAARLDAALYDEIEHDPGALWQSALVVVVAGLARGVGSFAVEGWVGLLAGTEAGALLWFTTSAVVLAVGIRVRPGASSFEELLRTLGFAAAPLWLLVLGALPLGFVREVLWLVIHAWAVLALVVAVRAALDTDTRRALLVCAGAIGLGLALLLILSLLFFGLTAA